MALLEGILVLAATDPVIGSVAAIGSDLALATPRGERRGPYRHRCGPQRRISPDVELYAQVRAVIPFTTGEQGRSPLRLTPARRS